MDNNSQHNAFDLLRLLLAIGVIVAHSYLLGGYNRPDFLTVLSKGQTNLADVSVMGFFVLSGYLISSSFTRTNPFSFVAHRLLRIYPGYWVCLLITGFGLATIIALLSNGNTSSFSYTGGSGSMSYFFKNFFIKINQWSVGNALNKAAYTESLNGSLWSLYPEVQCYALTLLLGLFRLFDKNRGLLLIIFVFTLTVFIAKDSFKIAIGPTFLYLSNSLKLYTSYLAGTILFSFRKHIKPDKQLLLFLWLCAFVLIKFGGFQLVSPLLIAYLLVGTFSLFKVKLRYDISYGMYIYAFPVQHILFLLFGNQLPLFFFILLSIIGASIFGLMSFIFVEKRFIRLKKAVDSRIMSLLNNRLENA